MDDEYKFWQYLMPYEASKYIMGLARTVHNKDKLSLRNIKYNIETGSEPQSVFLLDRARQKRYMLRNGYTVDNTTKIPEVIAKRKHKTLGRIY